MDSVIGPSVAALVEPSRAAACFSIQRESNNRSNQRGVLRNSLNFCCKYTLMPPKNTGACFSRPSASTVSGRYIGTSVTSTPRPRKARINAPSRMQFWQ